MAKNVKEKGPAEIQISERSVKSMTKRIFERLEAIETAKGAYMNRARREREAMALVYEASAAEGIPQKVAKLHVKIIRGVEQLKGWIADLEAEEQTIARKMAKVQGNKGQLTLFAEIPVAKVTKAAVAEVAEKAISKAAKAKAKSKPDKKAAPGVTGDDLAEADLAAGKTDEEASTGSVIAFGAVH